MTEKMLFVMQNPMCSGLSTVITTILSLSETAWTTTIRGRSETWMGRMCGWLGFSSQSLFTPSANTSSKSRLYSANAVSLIKRRYIVAKVLTVNATCGVTYWSPSTYQRTFFISSHIPIPIAQATDTVALQVPFSTFRASIHHTLRL